MTTKTQRLLLQKSWVFWRAGWKAVTGAEIDQLSDEELDRRIEEYAVYARVQPEHKVRIVDAWKRKGRITAMTGDGVNDAPSIKRADIGIGMGDHGNGCDEKRGRYGARGRQLCDDHRSG